MKAYPNFEAEHLTDSDLPWIKDVFELLDSWPMDTIIASHVLQEMDGHRKKSKSKVIEVMKLWEIESTNRTPIFSSTKGYEKTYNEEKLKINGLRFVRYALGIMKTTQRKFKYHPEYHEYEIIAKSIKKTLIDFKNKIDPPQNIEQSDTSIF